VVFPKVVLGGSFGLKNSGSKGRNGLILENSSGREEQCRLGIMENYSGPRRSIGNNIEETYYIDKIFSPCLLSLIAAMMIDYLYAVCEQSRYKW